MALKKLFIYGMFSLLHLSSALATEELQLNSELFDKLVPLAGNQSSPKSEIRNKDQILYFWATWCPDCKEKLTSTFQKSDLYKKFDVYLIATDKDLEKIAHFQKKFQIPERVFVDQDKVFQKQLKVFSVPTFVRIKKTDKGYQVITKQSGGDIEQHLENEK